MKPGPLALLIVLLWGLNWPAAAAALGGIPPLLFRVASLGLGGLLLLAYCGMQGLSLRPSGPAALPRLAMAALLNVAAWNLLSVYAIVELNGARAAILAFTMPFWTVLIERLLGERPGRAQVLALGLGALGLAGLVVSAGTDPSFSAQGAALMLLAALSWAGGSVYVRRRPVALPRAAFASWTLLLGALMVGLLLPLEPQTGWTPDSLSASALLGFLYAACIGMALCQACWFALLDRLGPTASALALLGIPPVGAAASWLLLAAPVSRLDIASLALLLLAAALPPLLKRPQQAP